MISRQLLARASRMFNSVADLRTEEDRAINEWFQEQLAAHDRCARCGQLRDSELHYIGTVDSHEFVSASPRQRHQSPEHEYGSLQAHVADCPDCREVPFNLCATGVRLLAEELAPALTLDGVRLGSVRDLQTPDIRRSRETGLLTQQGDFLVSFTPAKGFRLADLPAGGPCGIALGDGVTFHFDAVVLAARGVLGCIELRLQTVGPSTITAVSEGRAIIDGEKGRGWAR